jgi:hypothetical protein
LRTQQKEKPPFFLFLFFSLLIDLLASLQDAPSLSHCHPYGP